MFCSLICVSSGRFRPCYLQELFHVPPVLCGFHRSWQNLVAAVPPAVLQLSLQPRRPLLLVPHYQIPVLSVFPRRCLLPPQISGRTHPKIPALPPHLPGRTRRYPSRCSPPAQNQTSLPTPPPYSNHPPGPHRNHPVPSPPAFSYSTASPPEIFLAANDPPNSGSAPPNWPPASIRQR